MKLTRNILAIVAVIDSTVWKRTTTVLVRSSLSFGYCLMVMLGGMLVANKSYAQSCDVSNVVPGVRVVVQNLGKEGLRVRDTPATEGDNQLKLDGNKVFVYDEYEGTVRLDENEEYTEKKDKYIWYYVKWDDYPEAGWSAGIRDDWLDDLPENDTIKWIAPEIEAYRKDAIVVALFNHINRDKNDSGYIAHGDTKHDYNDYGCNVNWGKRWYPETGHAGWDVAALDGAVPFYSLTAGKLLLTPEEIEKEHNRTIPIFDGEKTTLYLHAKTVLVKPDANGMVHVGQLLGIQGKQGNAGGVHVHIEVQEGESTKAAAKNREKETINPIPYLYKWVADRREDWTPSRKRDTGITQRGGGFNSKEVQWDFTGDEEMNFLDQLRVLKNWGRKNDLHDVNGDGIVDMKDWHYIGNSQDDLHVPSALGAPASATIEGAEK